MRRTAIAVAFVVGAALIGGWLGLLAAALAVAVARRSGWEQVGTATVLALAAAAVASVVIDVPTAGSLRQSFADDRALASGLALVATVLLSAVVVDRVGEERRRDDEAPHWPPPGARSEGGGRQRAALPALAAAFGLGVLVRLLLDPSPLTTAEAAVVDGLQARFDGDLLVRLPPGGTVTALVSPLSPSLLLALLGGLLSVQVTRLSDLVVGARGRWPTVALASITPMLVGVGLGATLGLLAVLTAVAVLWDHQPGLGRSVVAGALLAVGVLCRPELAVAGLGVVAWGVLRPSPLSGRQVATLSTGTLALVVPWMTHVRGESGTFSLGTDLGSAFDEVGDLAGGPAMATLAWALVVVAVLAAVRDRAWFAARWRSLLPFTTLAAIGLVLVSATVSGPGALYAAGPAVIIALALPAARSARARTGVAASSIASEP